MMSQSKISSDYWLIRDESPDKWSIWQQWSEDMTEAAARVVALYTYQPVVKPILLNSQQAKAIKKIYPDQDQFDRHFIVFTDEIPSYSGPSAIDAHGNTPRPAQDDPTGRVRPVRTCPRHGKPMPHGRCPKCR